MFTRFFLEPHLSTVDLSQYIYSRVLPRMKMLCLPDGIDMNHFNVTEFLKQDVVEHMDLLFILCIWICLDEEYMLSMDSGLFVNTKEVEKMQCILQDIKHMIFECWTPGKFWIYTPFPYSILYEYPNMKNHPKSVVKPLEITIATMIMYVQALWLLF